MQRPVPNGKESCFGIEELFFSKTDHNGIILYGNDVFTRVSGYSWEQLNHAPHSIIRHPDMPRCVFKLLWDTIKADRPITAYVKNMAADGSHYWVLASVFPVQDGYLSIRMKPSSDLFKAIEAIYSDVLNFEKEKGMDEALNYLVSRVVGAGFPNYEALMVTALTEEMKAREAAAQVEKVESVKITRISQNRNSLNQTMDKITDITKYTTQEYLTVFKKIQEFDETRKLLSNKTTYLLDSFQDFELISLNMRVFAALLGDEGASLGVIASEFREIVASIEKHFKTFESTVTSLSKMMSSASLQICFIKLQLDMIDFLVKESMLKIKSGNVSQQEALKTLESNASHFLELAKKSYTTIYKEMAGLHSEIMKFGYVNKEIKKFVNGLEVIAQMGSVESARLNSSEQSFNVYIKRMEEFTEILKNSSSELGRANNSLDLNQTYVANTVKHTMAQLDEIFRLAYAMNVNSESEKSA